MIEPNFFTQIEELNQKYGRFVIEPLPLSFGHSLGNALRRTLLSSLEGCAITQVRFSGISHLFTTIQGVKESVLEIVLNLKGIRFKFFSGKGNFKVVLSKKGEGKVYAKDLQSEVKPVDGELYIAEITDPKGKIEMEAIAEVGRGLLLAEDQKNRVAGFIPIDAFFSPVKKVNFKVTEARVGRKSNYEKLMLEIETDGTISPKDALIQARDILVAHLSHIFSGKDSKKEEKEKTETQLVKPIEAKYEEVIIDELNLPSRVVNALLKEKIETVADLIRAGKSKLTTIKGLGRKSVDQIESELKRLGISFE